MKRAQVAAVLLAVLLFLGGGVVGVLGDRYYMQRNGLHHTNEEYRQHYIADMRSKVHLTDDQVHKLESIMAQTRAEFRAARDANMAKIKQEHVQRVRAILTPKQIPAYSQLVAEHERHARELDSRDR